MLHLAQAALRDALDELLPSLRCKEIAVQIGLDVAGAERVHADTVPRPFQGEALGHLHHARLGSGIGREVPSHAQPQDGGDVDDASGAPGLDQRLARSLCHAKDAVEVGVDDPVPIVLGGLERRAVIGHARVVDDDVIGLVEGSGHAVRIGDVHRHGPRAFADFGHQRLQPVDTAGGTSHMRPLPCQYLCEMRAEPRGSPGHQRSLALKFHNWSSASDAVGQNMP